LIDSDHDQKGYYGEDSAIVTPFRGKNLSEEEKDYNFRLNKNRQIIEKVNKRLKIFAIVSEWKRLDYDFHSICAHVVSKLTNLP
jgi:hypothetical protein